jgi:predicted methyltransferase
VKIEKRYLKLFGLVMLGFGISYQALAQEYSVPDNTPAHIRNAVESSARSDADTARDINRLPAEILTLADLNEGDTIIELSVLGQYYSTIMAEAIGSNGNLHMYDLVAFEGFGAEAGNAFATTHANTEYNLQDYDNADYPIGADTAYIINGYHDLPEQDNDPVAMNNALYAALRSGGKYIVIDHKAVDGSGWSVAMYVVKPSWTKLALI